MSQAPLAANAARESLETSLYSRIIELKNGHELSDLAISYYDYETTVQWAYNGDAPFHAASTMKIAVMATVFRQAASGAFAIGDTLHVRNRFESIVDGSVFRLSVNPKSDTIADRIGTALPIRELMHHMITTSSNLATNLLVQLVGIPAIAKALDELGVDGIRVLRGVQDEVAFEAGLNNETSANGLVCLLRAITEKRAFSEEASEAMLEILHDQKYRSGIPAGLPEQARVAHKTGNISTVHHDAGIVFFEERKPYVLAVLTEFPPGRKPSGAVAEITAGIHSFLGEMASDRNRSDA